MSAVLAPSPKPDTGWLGTAWYALRHANRRVWLIGLGLTAAFTVLNAEWLQNTAQHTGLAWAFFTRFSLQAWIVFVMLSAWVIADAGDDRRLARRWRLLLALLAGSLLAALLLPLLTDWFGARAGYLAAMKAKGEAPPPRLFEALVDTLDIAVIAGLVFATIEVGRRRSLTRAALDAAAAERAALSRRMFESRLAAMQAQVEPQFLFDCLVAVEALYRRDPPLAAATLDRLIGYLRVALPRLRESGSTLADEFALIAAYGHVLASLNDGAPQLQLDLPEALAGRRFAPMLLLPLLQRALRTGTPTAVSLRAASDGPRLQVGLDIRRTGLCQGDETLDRVRERLAGLYGAQAALDCQETGDLTRITITVDTDS